MNPLDTQSIRLQRFDLYRRLYERYLLEPDGIAPRPGVGTTVVPVILADDVLSDLIAFQGNVDIGSSNAIVETVPPNERWELLRIVREGQVNATSIRVDLAGTGTTFRLVRPTTAVVELNLPNNFSLDPGAQIQMDQGNVADTDIGYTSFKRRQRLD